MTLQGSSNGSGLEASLLKAVHAEEREILQEEAFTRMISIERKRTERSTKPFLLMLLEMEEHNGEERNRKALATVLSALLASTRETDIVGWYKDHTAVGAMFTELMVYDKKSLLSTMLTRVSAILRDNLTFDQFNQISISFHFFPDKWDHDMPDRPSNPTLYPDLSKRDDNARHLSVTKRVMDVTGSLFALLLLAPIFLVIAVAVKLTSKGPIFFKQPRVGQYGKPFTFLKFRSMYHNNDASVHRDYVTKLIAGKAQVHPLDPNGNGNGNGNGQGVYKLTNDSRITAIGGFLRRSSLDELPQFINVLRGEMSLVGPRPAIPYEVAAYQTWHRRRVLEVKPGITGLWQVNGRSSVKFDEMVRLDLRYARGWSPLVDIKILLRTPRAVLMGSGAH